MKNRGNPGIIHLFVARSMLSTFETLDTASYVVWSTENEQGLTITATDGLKIWHTATRVTASDKPASRKHESDESFMTQLKRSLRTDSASSLSSEVDFKLSGDNVQLTIKETLGSTSTKSVLYKATLLPVEDIQLSFMNMFAEISAKIRSDEASTATLNKTISEYIQQIDILSSNTKEMGTMKDKLQDELVSKMCMVLNCKKREIERLNQRVVELENAAPSESEHNADVIDLTGASAAPVGTKRAKAPPKPRATKAKAVTAPRGGGTSISSTAARGAKRKASAVASKKTASKRRRGESDSESEAQSDDDSDEEGSLADFFENDGDSEEADGDDGNGSEGSGDGRSDNESDNSGARLPQVTPSSQPAQARGVRSATASSAAQKAAKAGDGVGGAKAVVAAAVSLSLPLAEDTLPETGLKGTDNDGSDSDGPLIKWKSRAEPAVVGSSVLNRGAAASNGSNNDLARTVTKAGATQSTKGTCNNSAVGSVSKISNGTTSIAAKGGALSKFYSEENSEDEGNCMNYM